jgi:hypothetical protein
MGLACRQFRAFDKEALTNLLLIPSHWEILTMTAIGHRTHTAERGPRARVREATISWPRP